MDKFIRSDVLSYVNNFVILINLEGNIIFVNSAFEKLIVPKIELVGQGIDFFINQLGIEILSKSLNDILERLPLIDIEHIYQRDDGIELHILWSFLPQVNDSNTTEGIVVIGKDITELKILSLQVERLDNIIKYAPDWIYWKNKELIYLGCNERFAKAAGYLNPEDIIGKSDQELVWYKYAKKYNFDDQEVINTGAPKFGNEDLVPLGDGSQAIVISNKVPLRDPNGNTIGVLGISTDITEQKKTEEALLHAKAAAEELERLDNIIKYAPDWIYWKDKNSVYLGCNDQLAIAAGYSNRNDMIGKSDFDLPWHEHAQKYHLDDREVIESGKPKLNIEEVVTTQRGKKTITITNKVPLRGIKGEIIGVLGIATDITKRKSIEEELLQAKIRAEAANYLMTEFISNMGHDLATPISDVGSIAQMLDFYADEYPELKELFDTLISRAEACEEVRKTILNATSISNLDVKLETFSTAQALLELEKELRPTIGSKNLKLIIHPLKQKKEDIIETDREKFYAILYDLISNAINFTEAGQVTISVMKEGNLFHIKVSDTGIGIPADKFDYIFQQYTKLSRSNKYGPTFKGVGAGLYLAKIRANILNATIRVESEVGKGSTFTLSIPAHQKEQDKNRKL
jgi:two-component system, OmpR family, aerobic respiration control sensor histidine kinase ArcB